MKQGLLAVAAAAALVAGGCGGDDSNGPLSYSDYGSEISDICSSAAEDGFNEASAKLTETGEPRDLAPVVEQFAAITDDIEAVEAPAELQPAAADYIAARDEAQALFEEAQQIAEDDGDPQQYVKLLAKATKAESASLTFASKLGAELCLPDAG